MCSNAAVKSIYTRKLSFLVLNGFKSSFAAYMGRMP